MSGCGASFDQSTHHSISSNIKNRQNKYLTKNLFTSDQCDVETFIKLSDMNLQCFDEEFYRRMNEINDDYSSLDTKLSTQYHYEEDDHERTHTLQFELNLADRLFYDVTSEINNPTESTYVNDNFGNEDFLTNHCQNHTSEISVGSGEWIDKCIVSLQHYINTADVTTPESGDVKLNINGNVRSSLKRSFILESDNETYVSGI